MSARTFLLNPTRTARQGAHINVGKDDEEYRRIVSTVTICPADLTYLGIEEGDSIRVRTEFGEATFECEAGNVPEGLLFVPYGPPTCRLMGGSTDGTGMPTSKGWVVEVQPVPRSK